MVALLVTIIAPVVYGWKTGDTKGAMLVGAVPFLFVMTIPRIALGEIPRDTESLIRVAAYVVPLSVIGGLEGFFAAQKEEKSILFAIILVFIWIIVLLSGLN